MEKKDFVNYLRSNLPVLFEQDIVLEEKLGKSFEWYSKHIDDTRKDNVPIYFYDWILLSMGGSKKAQSFVNFCQQTFEELINACGGKDVEKLKGKIWESIYTPAVITPSYMDSLGEIFTIFQLVKNASRDGYTFLGTDFEIGNGKNVDLAFERDGILKLVEISNIRHLKSKNLVEELRKRCNEKLSKKTKQKQQIVDFLINEHPRKDVYLAICIFVWEDTFNISGSSKEVDKLVNKRKDDLLPPITLLCQEDSKRDFHWSISPLTYALERCQENT